MKKYFLSSILSIALLYAIGQTPAARPEDSIVRRIIFIGDAGEMNKEQRVIISDATSRIITGKTTVMYLGDNIYSKGMTLSGGDREAQCQEILKSQFQPMRNQGASVYFVPGNYDWDKSGKNGFAKIKRQWEFINQQNDSLLKLIPANGCPDPVEINLGDELTIIAFDSEWWLFPFNKTTPGGECECTTKEEVVARLEELFYRNRYKVILLTSHHPFQSYGVHGGNYTWKDHLFPLTAASKGLYVPLPVIGSLYTFFHKSFAGPEYLRHPLYRDMIKRVDHVFDSFPNLVHVAGHERGLQLIKDKQVQIVSGAGANGESALKRKNSLFAEATQGYVTIDLLKTNETRFTYYTYNNNNTAEAAFSYTQPYNDVKSKEELTYNVVGGDSIEVSAYAPYDNVSKIHRSLFGESYRKEWATPTKLPVLRISELKGGLTPLKRGGGHQTMSLRLKDPEGKEWVIRSIEKHPDVLLPEQLRETFAKDVVHDAMVAQNPYAPLMVPVLSTAANVPHSNPVIGYIAPDKRFGIYQKVFANKVCLMEEREPLGNSDNTAKMLEELNKDNDNSVDSNAFFRARLLDFYLADWDRHEDQWRWLDTKKGGEKKYLAIPRDRDQAFYRNEGFFPQVASQGAIAPFLRGFKPTFKRSNEFFINGAKLDNRFLNQLDHEQWMTATHAFTASLTDSVLDAALKKLPKAIYDIRHDELFDIMKKRRDNLTAASEKYFFFLNKVADIRVSDKNELIRILDGPDHGLLVVINKISKEGKIKEQLFSKNFLPSSTKEIRIFIGKGDDSVLIDTKQSSIKLRIVGGEGKKAYNVANTGKKIHVYEKETNASFYGMTKKLRKHLSDDSLNVAIVPTNRYNSTVPFIVAGLNLDDGLLLGLSLKHTHQGFRKSPYASIQQYSFAHAFSTKAFRFAYRGEWLGYNGKPDFLLSGVAKAPDNTQNFFGRGNETPFYKIENYKTYYRARFTIYQGATALRWRGDQGSSISVGPGIQYYHYDPDQNKGRFVSDASNIGSYDSSTLANDKAHLGIVVNFIRDKKNNQLFPTWGFYINIRAQAFAGLNQYSKGFAQILPELGFYKPLNDAKTIIVAERFGGGVSFGKTTFYQSIFIGGHDNLNGYRQYRFAGQHSLYNNLEIRLKLTDFANYIVPGQFGLIGFYDVGRVWENGEKSHQWHNGLGGGFYFTPAQLVVLQIIAGYSKEGWYPVFSLGFRF